MLDAAVITNGFQQKLVIWPEMRKKKVNVFKNQKIDQKLYEIFAKIDYSKITYRSLIST